MVERREDWFEAQLDLDPAKLVFVDESFASTTMARLYGRAPRGVRLRAAVPHGHRKKTTLLPMLTAATIHHGYLPSQRMKNAMKTAEATYSPSGPISPA